MARTHLSKTLTSAAALALIIACAGCKQQAASGSADPDAAKKAIQADEKQWNADFKAKNAEALVGHYADDAFFIGPGVKSSDGSTQIRKVYAEGLSDPNFEISFASDKIDVAASGDLAYARGRFTEKFTDPQTQKVMSTSGSYITVYKKQQDGSWKAEEDFAASDPDATKPVPPAKPATHAKMVSF